MNFKTRVVTYGTRKDSYWWTSDLAENYSDLFDFDGTQSFKRTHHNSFFFTRPLRVLPPNGSMIYASDYPDWAFQFLVTNEGNVLETGIASAHQVDVHFRDATEGLTNNDEETVQIGKIWELNSFSKTIRLGISYFLEDGTETNITPGDRSSKPMQVINAIEMQVRFKKSMKDNLNNHPWQPHIAGFKIYLQIEGYKNWYETMTVDFRNGTWRLYNGERGEFVISTGDLASYPEGEGWEDTMRFGMECKMVNTTDGINTSWPLIFHPPLVTYEAVNSRLAFEDYYPDFATGCIANGRMYAGNIEVKDTKYGDRMIRSSPGKYGDFNSTDYIDVEVSDGDEIIRLISLGSQILQFKRNKLFIIDTSGEVERLVQKEKA